MSDQEKVRLKNRRLRFRPSFKGPIEGYLVNSIQKNLWRVDQVMTREDLYQDGLMIFCLIRQRYAHLVDNPKWFMALYKRALSNHIHDISKVQTKLAQLVELPIDIEDSTPSMAEAEAIGLLADAPPEVSDVVRLFLHAPSEWWTVLSRAWNARGSRRKSARRVIAGALGREEGFDARRVVHAYLNGSEEG